MKDCPTLLDGVPVDWKAALDTRCELMLANIIVANVVTLCLTHTPTPSYSNPCWHNATAMAAVGGSPTASDLLCFPAVYLLGPAKSGSTTLNALLTAHADIVDDVRKEPHFWAKHMCRPGEKTP